MVLGFGRVGGGRLVLKNGFLLEQRPPQYYRGAVPQRAILLVAASCKNGTFNLGLRRDGASINEGKDPERVGHLEQSADQGLGRVGRHAVAGLHGRSAGTRGEAGTLHWQFAVQWQNPRSFAAIKKDLPLAHFEEVKSWTAAVTYCQKADTRDSGPWEFGTRPTGGSGKAQAEDWETWYQLAAEGKFAEIPPKFKSSTWAIWSAFTARISNSSTKQMCAESGFGALQESARATLPAKCWEPRVTT